MPAQEPYYSREANHENARSIEWNNRFRYTHNETQREDSEPPGEQEHGKNEYTLLPRLTEPVGVRAVELHADALDQRSDEIARRQEDEYARKPGTETREEAPERAKRPVGPDVDRTVGRHKAVELPRHNSPGKEKGERTNDPVQIGDSPCRLCRLDNSAIRDEDDNSDKKDKQIHPLQNARQDFARALLGAQRAFLCVLKRGRSEVKLLIHYRHYLPLLLYPQL